ncbi:MAG: GAF domain-containing protein [Anaerolineales bacterium]
MEVRADVSRKLVLRRILLIAILADVVAIGAYTVQFFLNPAWQMEWMIANAGGLLLVYLMVYFLLRRPAIREERQISRLLWVAILATELSFIGSAFTIAGLEIFYAVILILLIVVASRPSALAQNEYPWAVVSALAAGALILLPLALPLEYRLAAPSPLRVSSYSILGLTLVLYGFYVSAAYPISLRVKIPFATVFISLLSVIVIAVLANRIATQALQSAGETALESAAIQVSTQLDNYILNNIEIVRTQAQLPLLRNYLLAQVGEFQRPVTFIEVGQTLLSFQSRNVQYIVSYGLLNERGIVVADTVNRHMGRDESGEEYFRRAILGISGAFEIRYRGSPPQQVIAFAAPVRAVDGHPIGVLRFWLLPSAVQQIVSANSGLAGEQSFAILVDENGIVLAHGERPQMSGNLIRSLDDATLNALYAMGRILPGTLPEVAPMSGLAEGLEQLPQARFFDMEAHAQEGVVSKERATARRMYTLPWTVVYYQSTDFFTQPLRAQRNVIVLATLGLSLLVALIGVLISEAIVRPLRQLRDAAQRVQQGDLNINLVVQSRDETGVLAEAFTQMVQRTRDVLNNLEARVQERTLALAERSSYLQAVADVGRLIFSLRDPQALIARVVEIIRSRFGLYYVGLFEVDGSGEWAVLRAGTGEAGKAMLARGHRIRIGSGMIGWSIAHNQPRIAQQAELDAVRLRTPELPETRSEAALPLRTRSGVIGALTIQSARPNAFNPDNLAIFQVLADLVASALENAHLYAEMENVVHSLEHVFAERVRSTLEEYFHAHGSVTYRSDGTQVWEDPRAWHAEMEEALKRGEPVIGEQTLYEQEMIYPLALPILLRGQAVGVLRTYKPAEKGPWTSQEVRVLQNILDQIALTLEASQLFEQTQQRAIYEHILSEITGKVWSASGVEGILQTAVRELGRALNAGEIEIALTEDGHEA